MNCPACRKVMAHVKVVAVPLGSVGGHPKITESFPIDATGRFTAGNPDHIWYNWDAECPHCGEVLETPAAT